MRLTTDQIQIIRSTALQLLGDRVRVTLFGSRVNDALKGGDVDLMLEVPEAIDEPARVSARIASRVSRAMNGRRVDVVLKAPNLMHQRPKQVFHQVRALDNHRRNHRQQPLYEWEHQFYSESHNQLPHQLLNAE